MTKLLSTTTVAQIADLLPKEMNLSPSPVVLPSNNRDRTNEFRTTVKTFATKRNGLDCPSQAPVKHDQYRSLAIEQRRIFMQNAKRIGDDLSQTFFKLERLTLLAKQSSLFNDESIEIQNLILNIKKDISHLNHQIEQLQESMPNTKNSKSRNSQIHFESVVFILESKVATMSNDLKQILEARIQNLKEQKSRRDNFSKNTAASPSISHSSILLRDDCHATNRDDTIIDMGSDGIQQLQIVDDSDSYYASRSEAMQNIEQTIIELGEIFTQLAIIIQKHEESIVRIDENMNDALVHIEEGHNELIKYLHRFTSNRWLIIKVFWRVNNIFSYFHHLSCLNLREYSHLCKS